MNGKTNNNTEDIFAKLRAGAYNFSSQQKQICSFILENFKKVVFYTVEELAKASETSPATVVRVVKHLGYGNYKELLEDLQRANGISDAPNTNVWWELEQVMNDTASDEYEPTMSWVSRDTVEGIKETISRQLMDTFDDCIEMMLNADAIGIVGMRSSKFVAGYMHFMLNQLFSNTYLLNSTGYDVLYDRLVTYGKNDLVIAISLGGPHFVTLTNDIVSFAKNNNVPTILITNDVGNPIIDSASKTLLIGKARQHYSIIPAIVLAEAIITELALRKKDIARKRLKQIEKVLLDKKITME